MVGKEAGDEGEGQGDKGAGTFVLEGDKGLLWIEGRQTWPRQMVYRGEMGNPY